MSVDLFNRMSGAKLKGNPAQQVPPMFVLKGAPDLTSRAWLGKLASSLLFEESEETGGEGPEAHDSGGGHELVVIAAEQVFGIFKESLNGIITNDKFCLTRWAELELSWWRRPLRLRDGLD